MLSPQEINDNLESILFDVMDSKSTEVDFEALVAALRTSEDLRKRACLFLCDESLLSDEEGTTGRASRLHEMLTTDEAPQFGNTPEIVPASVTRSANRGILTYINHHGLAIAAMAALVIIGLFAQNMLMMAKFSRLHALVVQNDSKGKVEVVVDPTARPNKKSSVLVSGEVVGRVIGLNDVHWRPGSAQFTYGDSLDEGQTIRLESGGIEILLANGAKITATGPADFELSSLLKMDLDRGKIVAAVPRTARGYTIMTPASELVDIGTQFGVAVADSGETELHVFDGDVLARSRVNEASADFMHYKENEAIRFDSDSPELERFAAQEAGFVRRLGPVISTSDLPQLPVVKNLCLWYSADMIRDANVGEPVSTWRDILVGDNKFANDARQFDPRRYPKLITDNHGFKSLRFDGWSTSLQIDPIDYLGSYTMFLACATGPTSFATGVQGGILFKHGEAPSLEMSILSDLSARSWVWPGRDQNNVAIVKSEPLQAGEISLIACQYDSEAGNTQMWLNGVSQQESKTTVELRPCAQAFLGSHYDLNINAYFFGSMYEIVIYDGTLDAPSMKQVVSYFKDRYLIAPISQQNAN
jgi:hypothetical protein